MCKQFRRACKRRLRHIPETMKTLASRIAYLRKDVLGISQAQFGGHVGVSRGAVANWEVGGDISRENLRNISTAFNVTLDWLDKGRGAPPESPLSQSRHTPVASGTTNGQYLPSGAATQANAKIDKTLDGPWREIPVYGQAVAGVDGEFLMNGNVLFHAFAPPNVVAIENAYGVRVSGESMKPRYLDGEVVFVDPSRTPRRDDYVVVQVMEDEHSEPWAYVKQFVRHNNRELVLTQHNPPKEMVFDHARVVSVHVVVMAGMA